MGCMVPGNPGLVMVRLILLILYRMPTENRLRTHVDCQVLTILRQNYPPACVSRDGPASKEVPRCTYALGSVERQDRGREAACSLGSREKTGCYHRRKQD